MKIIQAAVKINSIELNPAKITHLANYTQVCYQSTKHSNDSSLYLAQIIKKGHESVIEHEKVTVTFIVDRGISNQIIRHRIASYSQESTRYCNYSLDKFGNGITVIEPFFYRYRQKEYDLWEKACRQSETAYLELLKSCTPEEARTVLPNSLKTELVTTYNFREWRHFFSLRCAKDAHPQLLQVTIPLLLTFKKIFAPLFDDIPYDKTFSAIDYAEIIKT